MAIGVGIDYIGDLIPQYFDTAEYSFKKYMNHGGYLEQTGFLEVCS